MNKLLLALVAAALVVPASTVQAKPAKAHKAAPAKVAPIPFSIQCDAMSGVSTYVLGTTTIGNGPECGEGWEPFVADEKTYSNLHRVILVQAGGGGMASSGSIILIAPGAAAKVVPVDYLTEFRTIKSDTQVVISAQGVVDPSGAPCTTSKLLSLDWVKGTSTSQDIAHAGACG